MLFLCASPDDVPLHHDDRGSCATWRLCGFLEAGTNLPGVCWNLDCAAASKADPGLQVISLSIFTFASSAEPSRDPADFLASEVSRDTIRQ